MYRTIDAKFWHDPKIDQMSPLDKLLALYLVTNPHSHVGGIYYLPEPIILTETKLAKRQLDPAWDTLSSSGFARRDKKLSVVWVVNMFKYQARGEKNERSVAKQIGCLHNSFLIRDFLKTYPSVKRWIPIGYPAQDEFGTPDQEQDQEQEQEIPPYPPKGESESFEQFWKAYPRKEAKGAALKAWTKAIKAALPESIIKAAAEFAASPIVTSRGEPRFIPHPATWLNGQRWLDDRENWQINGTEQQLPFEDLVAKTIKRTAPAL